MPPRTIPRSRPLITTLLLALAASPALAADPAPAADPRDAALAELRAQVEALQARIAALEAQSRAAPVGSEATRPEMPAVAAGPGLDIEVAGSSPAAFGIGGRIHYEAYAFDRDLRPATGGSEFRRVRVQVEGEAAGWGYRVQAELSGRHTDLRDVYLQRAFGDSMLTIGQFKPFRSMEELTSSNDAALMERSFNSAAGLFADRQWQQGVGLLHAHGAGSLGLALFKLREDNTPRNEGWGGSVRATWAPYFDDRDLLHLGAWWSHEQGGRDTPAFAIQPAYGGRRGPEALLFEAAPDRDFSQRSGGVELAGRRGSLHWQGEWTRTTVAGPVGEARIAGAYLEAGWLFGGVRGYELGEGVFAAPLEVGRGGLWELVARGERMHRRDLHGFALRRWVLGLNWYASEDLRFMLNLTEGRDEASGDAPRQLAVRAQYVF
ncbi:MAG: hypothetical protein KGZ52_11615 [Xanthomonadaceae bacterium]|jgi:phosphate-selective porin OprO/OprP|nr:hypothetical protein [Xanthomonadaceae bacterium]